MKASDFLEALIGKEDAYEQLSPFDAENVLEAKNAFKKSKPINILGASSIGDNAFRLASNDKFTRVSPRQLSAAQAYNLALQNLL